VKQWTVRDAVSYPFAQGAIALHDGGASERPQFSLPVPFSAVAEYVGPSVYLAAMTISGCS
jgi:hypothetical protein